MRSVRGIVAGLAIVVASGVAALAAPGTAAAQSPAAIESVAPSSSPGPTPSFTIAPGEIGLRGTVVGHYDNMQTEAWQSHTVAEMSMELSIALSATTGRADGTFSISGDTANDCHYSDRGVGTVHWDFTQQHTVAADGEPWGSIFISMADPRYVFPDLKVFVLSVGSGIRRWGGTCGYTNGPLFDADPQISVGVPGCTLEVALTGPTTWEGTCADAGATSLLEAHFETLPSP